MEDMKVRKLREKLGISDSDQKEAAGKAIGPNLRAKISSYSGAGGNFVSAPPMDDTLAAGSRAVAGGNFVSAPPAPDAVAAGPQAVAGGNFVSAPPAPDASVAETRLS